jgi:hypothetical protein
MAHPDDLEKVIQGCDAVLSAAGPVKGHDSSFLVGAVRNITSIMKKNGISRIVWLTGAGVMDTRDEKDFMRPLIRGLMKLTAGSVLKASEEAYGALIQSDLDYTVVRAPVLSDSPSNKPLLAGYKPPKPSPIGRDSLAGFMLRCLSDGLWLRESPMIGL